MLHDFITKTLAFFLQKMQNFGFFQQKKAIFKTNLDTRGYPKNGPPKKLPYKLTIEKGLPRNCSNSVSFHAICLKFFLVGSLKISLRVLAFSELSGRLPLATFAVLVHLFCFFHRKYFLSLPSPVTLTFSNLSSCFSPKRIYCLT